MEYTKSVNPDVNSSWSEAESNVTGGGSEKYLYKGLDLMSNSVSFKNGDWITGEKYYVGGMIKVNKECEGLFHKALPQKRNKRRGYFNKTACSRLR